MRSRASPPPRPPPAGEVDMHPFAYERANDAAEAVRRAAAAPGAQFIAGGSDLCVATHASDLAVALVALDARLALAGPQGEREVALDDFHLLPGATPERETLLLPGELITAVTVPASPLARRSAYLKVRDR